MKILMAAAAIAVMIVIVGAVTLTRQSQSDVCVRWLVGSVDLQGPFRKEGEHAYIATDVPGLENQSDNPQMPSQSTAILCENGKAIGTGHSLHDDIRSKGGGLYSHWSGALYFSTSDNSDPNENGRNYKLVFLGR